MKLSQLLSVASLSTLATAIIYLDNIPPTVYAGDVQQLHWKTNENYTIDLLLVHYVRQGTWHQVGPAIRKGMFWPAGHGTLNWTIPSNCSAEKNYALVMNGLVPNGNGLGTHEETPWFHILGGQEDPGTNIERDVNPGDEGEEL